MNSVDPFSHINGCEFFFVFLRRIYLVDYSTVLVSVVRTCSLYLESPGLMDWLVGPCFDGVCSCDANQVRKKAEHLVKTQKFD